MRLSHARTTAEYAILTLVRLLQDVLINEGIVRQRTLYYLAFVVRGENRLVLGFEVRTKLCVSPVNKLFTKEALFLFIAQHFHPRLHDLLHAYHGTRATLQTGSISEDVRPVTTEGKGR